jgi:general secretion pathway protein M
MLLVAAAMLAFAAIAVPAWMLYHRYDTASAQFARQLKSYTGLNQQRPALLKAVEELKKRDTKRYFVKGATAALAGAELQDIAKSIIESNSGRMLSSQLLAHKDDAGFRQVTATIQMTATMQNLRVILHTLETKDPYCYLDNLTIRSQVPSGFKPQPGFEPELFVQFDVSAYGVLSAADAAPKQVDGGKAAATRSAKP